MPMILRRATFLSAGPVGIVEANQSLTIRPVQRQ
jgi:hypothetical protein